MQKPGNDVYVINISSNRESSADAHSFVLREKYH